MTVVPAIQRHANQTLVFIVLAMMEPQAVSGVLIVSLPIPGCEGDLDLEKYPMLVKISHRQGTGENEQDGVDRGKKRQRSKRMR